MGHPGGLSTTELEAPTSRTPLAGTRGTGTLHGRGPGPPDIANATHLPGLPFLPVPVTAIVPGVIPALLSHRLQEGAHVIKGRAEPSMHTFLCR